MRSALRVYRLILQVLCLPVFLSEYFDRDTGRRHGLGFWSKFVLAVRMVRNNMRIVSGSTFIEHLMMATEILNVPPEEGGVVVECGTYKGVSAANLSLACALAGRRLVIFDSFAGLPPPSDLDRAHMVVATSEQHTYEAGSWCGSLEEVRENITTFGDVTVCTFVPGYFEDTLPSFDEPCIQIWADVDYRSSLETCVAHLWPLLHEGRRFYTHEARHLEIASLFFSESWWSATLGEDPPGLIGAGTGLGFKILSEAYFNSSIAYTVKHPPTQDFRKIAQVGGVKLTASAPVKVSGGDSLTDPS